MSRRKSAASSFAVEPLSADGPEGLPQEATVAGVELDSTPSPRDYPRGYKAELSTDGQKWTEVAKGKGNDAITEIEFPAAKAKFIRLTQTGAVDGLFWSIHELQVLAGK